MVLSVLQDKVIITPHHHQVSDGLYLHIAYLAVRMASDIGGSFSVEIVFSPLFLIVGCNRNIVAAVSWILSVRTSPQTSITMHTNTPLPHLRNEIATAIEDIPEAHRIAPVHGAIVSDPNSAFIHLQDWAFTQGYCFVIASSNDIRVRFNCIHHSIETRNTRKLTEGERRRIWTNVYQQGCKVSLYVSKQKRKGDNWVFGYSRTLSKAIVLPQILPNCLPTYLAVLAELRPFR